MTKQATGLIFDIREFTLHDGPGIRTTIFLKGCPLNCDWCHNPESRLPRPQMMHSPRGDRVVGKLYTPEVLAAYLNGQAAILTANEGGVTFSGGEPLMQAAFLHEVLDLLEPVHKLLDTSGYAAAETFRKIVRRFDLVYYDLKLIDRQAHLAHCGVPNDLILENLRQLSASRVPFVIRIPLIPTLTDTTENLTGIADFIQGLPGLVRVDLLPYNALAGAKYPLLDMEYKLHALENVPVHMRSDVFLQRGIDVLCQ